MFKGVTESPLSLWSASAPAAPATSPLVMSIDVDVAIVGGGFTGLSTALHLAEQGSKVAVLEAQGLGHGGSGRNVGLANAGLWLEPDQMDALMGKAAADRLYRFLADAPNVVYGLIERHQIQCEAVRNGTLHLGHSAKGVQELERRHRQLVARGAPVELKDRAETQRLTGSPLYQGALFDPRAGTIQPLAYARGLATAAIGAGAQLFTQSPVTDIQRQGEHWLLKAPQGQVKASKVVIATNAYTEQLFPELKQSFVPIYYFQYASKPLTEQQLSRILPERQGCWDTRTVMCSFRMDQAGRLVLGSMGNLLQGDKLRHWSDRMTSKLFPWLGPVEWDYRWVGQIAYSNDHLPHFHQLADGIHTCLGYSGRGIGPGTTLGKAMAGYLLGDKEAMPVSPTSVDSISWRDLRHAFYETGARVYHARQCLI